MKTSETEKLIVNLLDALTVEFEKVEYVSDRVQPVYHVSTNDSGVLIGTGGENLRALSYIVRRIVERRSGGDAPHFLLDVNGYHTRRIKELQQQAKLLAERARMFRSSVEMQPTNAYERMIIHNAFSDDAEIITESTGEGKTRRIVFKYNAKEESRLLPKDF